MPSPITTEISLTVRLGVPIVPILPNTVLASWLDEKSDYYVIGYEESEPGDKSTGHYQCAVRLREACKVENFGLWVFRKMRNNCDFEFEDKHEKRTVKVRKHHDLECLAGGYCRKQDTSPIVKGWDSAVLLAGQERYEEALESKKKKIPVCKSSLISLIREYITLVEERMYMTADGQGKWGKLTSRQKYDFVAKLIIADGYDLSTISPLQVSHIVKFWDEYFENFKNSKNILDEFFE